MSFSGNAPPEILTDVSLIIYFETRFTGLHDAALQEALERLMEQIPNQNEYMIGITQTLSVGKGMKC